MASGTELFNAWKEGFEKRDSSKLAELLTDDFQMVSRPGIRSRQATLDWTSAGDMALDNLEVVYENDYVAVIHHNVKFGNNGGISKGVFAQKGREVSQCGYVRTAI